MHISMVYLSVVRVITLIPVSRAIWVICNVLRNYSILEYTGSKYPFRGGLSKTSGTDPGFNISVDR